jgi:hypothetical protein
MLVIFKSAPILKKILRVKQAMLQFYALKLLKMQTRHLGRQWRKTNMSLISAIYQKVRHRLNDDWAFGNEQEAQAWDFQSDECALRAKIDSFIQRNYKAGEESAGNSNFNNQNISNLSNSNNVNNINNNNNNSNNNNSNNNNNNNNNGNNTEISGFDFIPTDNSILSYLNKEVKLPEDFESNYEKWLDEEVFSNKIDWDLVLNPNTKPIILF